MSIIKRHNANSYRSVLEQKFIEICAKNGWDIGYEVDKIKYTIPASVHTYTPDFTVAPNVYIETKGLWIASDRKKAIYLRDQHPDKKILYVFLRNQKLAKNSKTTYLEWCMKNDLDACTFQDKEYWTNYIKRHYDQH